MAGRDLFASQTDAPKTGRNLFAAQPKESDIPKISAANDVGAAEALLIGLGKGFTDVGRGIGLIDDATEQDQALFAELEAKQPIATTVGEITGQALPAVPLALGAELAVPALAAAGGFGTAATQAARIGAQGAVGAVEGGVIAEGTGKDALAGAGIGGTLAAGIEAVSPIAGRAVVGLFRKIKGSPPKGALITPDGKATPELQTELDNTGFTLDEFTDEAASTLQKTAPESAEQATRQAFLESQGLTGEAAPTQAQVKRGADEFQAQQEAAKTSTRVRQRLENQEAALSTRFDNKIIDTLGQSSSPTSPVIDAVVDKASVLDKQIGDLYNQARTQAAGDKNVAN
jgi:hypothetical protein